MKLLPADLMGSGRMPIALHDFRYYTRSSAGSSQNSGVEDVTSVASGRFWVTRVLNFQSGGLRNPSSSVIWGFGPDIV